MILQYWSRFILFFICHLLVNPCHFTSLPSVIIDLVELDESLCEVLLVRRYIESILTMHSVLNILFILRWDFWDNSFQVETVKVSDFSTYFCGHRTRRKEYVGICFCIFQAFQLVSTNGFFLFFNLFHEHSSFLSNRLEYFRLSRYFPSLLIDNSFLELFKTHLCQSTDVLLKVFQSFTLQFMILFWWKPFFLHLRTLLVIGYIWSDFNIY